MLVIYVGQRGGRGWLLLMAHLSAGVARGAGGLCTDVQEAAAFTLSNVSQPSPFTTKLQVTSGHLGPKINSSPCFKIEIKLKLRTKMYMLQFAAGFDAPFPLSFFLQDTCQKCTRENIHFCLSIFQSSQIHLLFIFWHLQYFWVLIPSLLKGLSRKRLAKSKWYSLMTADKNNDKCNLK